MNNGDSPLQEIDHIVVLMLENRSFDNLLGRLYTGKTAKKKGFDPMPLPPTRSRAKRLRSGRTTTRFSTVRP